MGLAHLWSSARSRPSPACHHGSPTTCTHLHPNPHPRPPHTPLHQSLKGMASDDCSGADCQAGIGGWIALFGAAELLLSQVPNLESLWQVAAAAVAAAAAAAGTATAAGPATAPVSVRLRESDRVWLGAWHSAGAVTWPARASAACSACPASRRGSLSPSSLTAPPPLKKNSRWVSLLGAIMSIGYSLIAGWRGRGGGASGLPTHPVTVVPRYH